MSVCFKFKGRPTHDADVNYSRSPPVICLLIGYLSDTTAPILNFSYWSPISA